MKLRMIKKLFLDHSLILIHATNGWDREEREGEVQDADTGGCSNTFPVILAMTFFGTFIGKMECKVQQWIKKLNGLRMKSTV